ncbi:hypothetical protein EVAR_84500_1 [Eumeta japonica]|uniref:Reverse transcriptase domain-containing protein n=1 Tax=Eumeta variegata TaxID=151549 RepID=A0A4C1UIZ0_EUMVA|nr:hypothetical protein EVAR_84500_1 [Eumeta japonica]
MTFLTLRGQFQESEDDGMLAFYADDSAYFALSCRTDLIARKVRRVFNLLLKWLDRWRMAVNIGKTAALLTGRQRKRPTQLRLRGQDVEWKSCMRYLGIHIDRSLRTIPQVNNMVQQNRAGRTKLRPILTSRLPTRIMLALYIIVISVPA